MSRRVILITAAFTLAVLASSLVGQPEHRPRHGGPHDGWHGPDGRRAKGHGPGEHGPWDAQGLTEQQEAELMEMLQEKRPWLYERMSRMKQEDPEHYRRGLGRMWKWYHRYKEMPEEEKQKELAKQEERMKILRLAHKYHSTQDPKERAGIEKELRKAVSKGFDSQMERRRQSLKKMEERLERLRSKLEEHEKNRNEVIEKRVKHILEKPRHRPGRKDGPTSRPAEPKEEKKLE